ncbi:MAG TPA: sialidase family protein, partial [Candidatus Thermoplasmatota archaeon]|nr:sialidase family protein [Candidatus Thermoplasmatota archaeon]
VHEHATYYCAQLLRTACATSLDGGVTWLPFTQVLGGCGGLHGHIAVSPTGFAAVPHKGCGSGEGPVGGGERVVGFAFTADNGATWGSRIVPGSTQGPDGGFDPSIDFSRPSGWMWIAQADELGIHVGLSKDEGLTWETIGTSTDGVEPGAWLNLNAAFRDPRTGHPIRFATFPDVMAGDDERAAISFMATTDPEGRSPFDDCSSASDANVWHYYLALTLDAGQTWTVQRLLEDPVQVGAIWDGGGGDPCRNLLDFNDADLDSQGRIHIAFADGCTGRCAEKWDEHMRGRGGPPAGADSRDAHGTILRQATGPGLFAAFDRPAPGPQPAPQEDEGETQAQPAPGLLVAALALLGAALLLRRR